MIYFKILNLTVGRSLKFKFIQFAMAYKINIALVVTLWKNLSYYIINESTTQWVSHIGNITTYFSLYFVNHRHPVDTCALGPSSKVDSTFSCDGKRVHFFLVQQCRSPVPLSGQTLTTDEAWKSPPWTRR